MKPLGFTLEEMRYLLDLTDRDDLTARLRGYAAATGERITALYTQLAHAEDFAATLRVRLAHTTEAPVTL